MSAAIFSDLHLGLASGADLLRREPVLEALLGAVADVDEVVLLGDVVELRERPVALVLADALPVLRRIGEAAAGKRITVVPGNHDHQLAVPLIEAARMRDGSGGGGFGVETVAEPPADGPMGAIADALGRDAVRLAYPGMWVRPDVFATHGHYLDVHNTVPTFERLAIGAVQRVVGPLPETRQLTPEDYEAAVGPVYALTYALAQSARRGRSVAGSQTSVRLWRAFDRSGGRLPALVLGGVALPVVIAGLNRAGLGPLKADLSAVELRRAGLRGMATVIERLGIDAQHVVFGHTHRSGPHPRDEGWGRLINTGSWIHEPAFLGSSPKESPYWPGHAAIVPDEGPPELVTLVEELP